jgi:hypothetical protein
VINSGIDLYAVGKVLGHADHKRAMRYSHLANDTLLAAVEAGAAKKASNLLNSNSRPFPGPARCGHPLPYFCNRKTIPMTTEHDGSAAFYAGLGKFKEDSGPYEHDQAINLITACIEQGISDGPQIIAALKVLGFNPRHVGKLLMDNEGANTDRHLWQRRAEGTTVCIPKVTSTIPAGLQHLTLLESGEFLLSFWICVRWALVECSRRVPVD